MKNNKQQLRKLSPKRNKVKRVLRHLSNKGIVDQENMDINKNKVDCGKTNFTGSEQ